jgi:uroporphyrinogen-III synthase
VRILLTRAEGDNERLAERLRAAGHDVESHALIEREPLGDEPIELDGYDWLILTSRMGASEMRRRGRGRPGRVAAIGPGTAEAYGDVDLVATESTQEGLLAELPRPAGRVLFAGAANSRRLLADELGADFLPLYRTRELDAVAVPDADVVVLASPSAARAYASIDRRVPVVSIGPETSRVAEDRGLRVIAEAKTHDLDGLVAAVASLTR